MERKQFKFMILFSLPNGTLKRLYLKTSMSDSIEYAHVKANEINKSHLDGKGTLIGLEYIGLE